MLYVCLWGVIDVVFCLYRLDVQHSSLRILRTEIKTRVETPYTRMSWDSPLRS